MAEYFWRPWRNGIPRCRAAVSRGVCRVCFFAYGFSDSVDGFASAEVVLRGEITVLTTLCVI